MKPIVIYVDKQSKTVTMPKEEFEKYLQDAYNQGYADGRNNNLIVTYPSTPVIPYYTPITCTTSNADEQTTIEKVPVDLRR